MALFDEAPAERPKAHVLGEDLSTLSLEEIDHRVALLEAEIEHSHREQPSVPGFRVLGSVVPAPGAPGVGRSAEDPDPATSVPTPGAPRVGRLRASVRSARAGAPGDGTMGRVSELIDTTEMYLRTIFELAEEDVRPMRARIAERLGQSGPTVSQTVARMQRDGLVELDQEDRHLVLTAQGAALAMRVMRKHRLAECLLVDLIGLRDAIQQEIDTYALAALEAQLTNDDDGLDEELMP